MGSFTKLRKAAELLTRPIFARAAISHRVAAAIEHVEAIRYARAETLIDIGANKGQFSLAFRAQRPSARIVAFEPLPSEAAIYEKLFAGDAGTELHRVAISQADGTATFYVTNRLDSSSLLPPADGQDRAFGVKETHTITVDTRRLASCVALGSLARPILMKIDVQGAELQVLQACDDLDGIDFVYLELSYVTLYEGQPFFEDVFAHLSARGFELAGVFNQVNTDEFGPTQADFLFRKKAA